MQVCLSLCFSAVQYDDLRHFPRLVWPLVFETELLEVTVIVITAVVMLLELVAPNLHLEESDN